MKRRSDLSRRYLIYRMVPYFEPIDGSEFDPSINTGLALKHTTLEKSKAKFMIDRKPPFKWWDGTRTIGCINEETVEKYIENQKNH